MVKFYDNKHTLLVPVHLPGGCNVQADNLSWRGQTLQTEWVIDPELSHPIFSRWGWIDRPVCYVQQQEITPVCIPGSPVCIFRSSGGFHRCPVDPVELDGHGVHLLTIQSHPDMGLLPDTQNCGCACAGNAGNVFPVTAGKRSRHASRHVRHARAVMHAGIAK